MPIRPRVVIVGSGFGGLNTATRLASAPVDITVVDRDNYHGFWPLLYQVATAGLSADDIARPIRAIYSRYGNISVRLGTVTAVDFENQAVEIDGVSPLHYDFLVLAAGSSTTDFGIPGVAEHAFPLKTLPDAVRLRNHVLSTFERTDAEPAGGRPPGALTIVLAGGGPTGVEMAGALSELIGRNLASDFHHLDVTVARVVLVEMTDHLLPGFSAVSQKRALQTLLDRGVDVRLGTKLAKVTAEGVTLEDGSDIAARTVVWTAGVTANPVASVVPGDKGRGGTVRVNPDLTLPGHPEVFVSRRPGRRPRPAWGCPAPAGPGRHPGWAAHRSQHPAPAGGQAEPPIPLSQPRHHGHDRSTVGRRRATRRHPLAGHPRLAVLARGSPGVPHRVSQPFSGTPQLGLELRHVGSGHPGHPRRRLRWLRPASAGPEGLA